MSIPMIQVDAFTDKPFAGNPAAVCLLSEPRDERWMQQVAQEMNLSETAFVVRQPDGFNLRWFTPAVEVELCGHATLASAHVLWEREVIRADEQVRFHTRSGLLTADRRGAEIELNFPARPVEETTAPPDLYQALGIQGEFIGRDGWDYLVLVDAEETVRTMKPDFGLLATINLRSVIVTGRASTAPFDFVSRFFAPRVGVNEDPVTGAAHCRLAPFWSARLQKLEMLAYQASPRGGVLRLRIAGDRVYLAGKAVTVLRGELLA